MHRRACAVARQYAAADDIIACRPGGVGLRRWENQRMLSTYYYYYYYYYYYLLTRQTLTYEIDAQLLLLCYQQVRPLL